MSDQTEPKRGRRTGGRAGRRAARAASESVSAPFLTRTFKPFELLSTEALEQIEHNADTILEQVGIDFLDYPSALTVLADAGAEVDGQRVRFPRGMCRKIVSESAPRRLHPARPQPGAKRTDRRRRHRLRPNYGSPFAFDLGRRPSLRQHRGLQQHREARLHGSRDPPLGGHGLRTGRHPDQQAPPRHGVCPPPVSPTSHSWAR